MSNITKNSIVTHLNTKLGLSKQFLGDAIDNIFDEIIRLASEDSCVKIKNFGSFNISKKSKRPGYVINSNKLIDIDERLVLKFSPSKSLKERINKIQ